MTRVTFGPGRIAVDLKFREPVAWVKVEGGQQIVDGQGRLLPSEDVDVQLVGALIQITGVELTRPADSRAGVVWKSKSAGEEVARPDERIISAARLARFLREHVGSDQGAASKTLRMVEIIVTVFAERGLFVFNSEKTIFGWGSAPTAKHPESLPQITSGRFCSGGASCRETTRFLKEISGSSRPRAWRIAARMLPATPNDQRRGRRRLRPPIVPGGYASRSLVCRPAGSRQFVSGQGASLVSC